MTGADHVFTGVRTLPPAAHGAGDPVLVQVVRHALASIAEQMKVTIVRTSMSQILYESLDFCCALYDADVRLLGQSQQMPIFLGTAGFCVEASVAAVGGPERLRPGDVLVNTYGYDIAAHPADAALVMPAFVGDDLVGYAVVRAHLADLGAMTPGFPWDATDIWQEGVILPGVKLVREGVLDRDMYRLMLANSRRPDAVEGDVNAIISALRTGVSAMESLVVKHGVENFRAVLEDMFDYGEKFMRAAIEALPNGAWSASSHLDSDPGTGEPIPLSATVEVHGVDVIVDLTEAPDAARGPINSPLPATVSVCRMAILAVLAPEELVNEGHLRPIGVRTRPGSLLHPIPPSPVYFYYFPDHLLVELLFRALSSTVPHAVRAGSGGCICGFVVAGAAGTDGSGFWVFGATQSTGQGARAHGDGGAPLLFICESGQNTVPAELYEYFPMVVRRMGLAVDSAGAGRSRGGLGCHTVVEIRDECTVGGFAERSTSPPWGLEGGHDGRPNRMVVTYPDGTSKQILKQADVPVPRGTIVEICTGGGGGWGPPQERAPEDVLRDVEGGYISRARAEIDYPHAFTDYRTDRTYAS